MANNNRVLVFGAVAVGAFLLIEHRKKTETTAIAPGANPPKLPANANPPKLPTNANPPKLPVANPPVMPYNNPIARISHFQSKPEVAWANATPPSGYFGAYNVEIPNSNTSIQFMLTPFNAGGRLNIAGSDVKAGTWSVSYPMRVGANVLDITSIGKDGHSIAKYRVYVTRKAGALKGIGYAI